VAFGKKKSEVTDDYDGEILKYLRNFRDGDNVVRFIDEVDEWIAYKEHFNANKQGYPCSQDSQCPGCNADTEDERKASRKYATNVYLPSVKLVLPYRVPITLAKKMFTRSERNGTITNRDWVVIRSGKGFDTEYDVEQDEKYALDLNVLRGEALDIEEVFEAMYNDVWGKPEEPKSEKVPDVEEISEEEIYDMSLGQLKTLAKKEGIDLPPFDMDNQKALAKYIVEELS